MISSSQHMIKRQQLSGAQPLVLRRLMRHRWLSSALPAAACPDVLPRRRRPQPSSSCIGTAAETATPVISQGRCLAYYSMMQQQQQAVVLQQQQQVHCFSTSAAQAEDESSSSSTTAATTTPSQQSSNSPKAKQLSERKSIVSKEDQHKEETKRKRISDVPISEVLKSKHAYRWVDPVISIKDTIQAALITAIEGGLSGMMVLDPDDQNHVVGLLTTRDLLRIMAAGVKEGDTPSAIFDRAVGDYMTPISQVIYGRPDETIGMARTLMAKLRIKCLPILSRDGQVEGLITARDMSDFGLSAKERGGKRAYLTDVSDRVGLSTNTSMAEPPTYLKAHLALEQKPLYINVGEAALPHPFKTNEGMAESRRDWNTRENTSDDRSLSEDAHFYTTVTLPDETDKELRKFTYLGVADGVGSWREYGVDPREFSHRLMMECQNVLEEAQAAATGQLGGGSDAAVGNMVATENKVPNSVIMMPPAQIMAQAYERVKRQNVIGSTTACVALFDGLRHQLHFSNLGDSGLIVLRHIDSDVAGALKRDRHTPRTERVSDLQVAFVSQQQLRSFNHPYQLGWTGDEASQSESKSFKEPRDSCTSSVHVRRGDIVVMATDGLFDNVDLDDIRAMALEWEQKHGFIRAGDVSSRDRRWAMGNSLTIQSQEHIIDFADALVERARANSLDSSVDSPFAILAKENDIMWSGGMPDDVTVLAFHVVGRDPDDVHMDGTNF